jgi:hypothetical protein
MGRGKNLTQLTSPRADEASEDFDTIFFPRVVRRQPVLVTLLRP